MYVWLTDKNKVNLVEVNGGMKKYSVRYDSEEDILKYIEEYLTEDGCVENLDIDYAITKRKNKNLTYLVFGI